MESKEAECGVLDGGDSTRGKGVRARRGQKSSWPSGRGELEGESRVSLVDTGGKSVRRGSSWSEGPGAGGPGGLSGVGGGHERRTPDGQGHLRASSSLCPCPIQTRTCVPGHSLGNRALQRKCHVHTNRQSSETNHGSVPDQRDKPHNRATPMRCWFPNTEESWVFVSL